MLPILQFTTRLPTSEILTNTLSSDQGKLIAASQSDSLFLNSNSETTFAQLHARIAFLEAELNALQSARHHSVATTSLSNEELSLLNTLF